MAVYRRGIFDMTISGSVTVGDAVVCAAEANMVKTAHNFTTLSGANIVGIALETGTTGQVIQIELAPQTVRSA